MSVASFPPLNADQSSTDPIQSEQSKFVQHLATYPAVTALAGLVASFPVAKIFVSNAVPLLHAIHERSRPIADPVTEQASPYFRSLDEAGDVILDKIDRRFPQLAKVQPAEVYEDAQNYFDSVKSNAFAAYDSRVGRPISQVTSAARSQIDTAVPRIQDVYAAKLNERVGENSEQPGYIARLLAALATGKFLSIESYRSAVTYFGSPEALEGAVNAVRARVFAANKSTADPIVDDAVAEAKASLNE